MKYKDLMESVNTLEGSITEKIEQLCEMNDEHEIYDHMEHVAYLAKELADHYHLNQEEAYLAGFMHDIGRIVDKSDYHNILESYQIEVTEDDLKVPDVLHGKISSLIVKEVFNVTSEDIHNGILYHTTLRKNPSDFEKVIFLADKLTWTYDDLIYQIEETVTQSLNVACYNALTWMIEHIQSENGLVLDVTQEAYLYFKGSMLL